MIECCLENPVSEPAAPISVAASFASRSTSGLTPHSVRGFACVKSAIAPPVFARDCLWGEAYWCTTRDIEHFLST